MDTTRLRISASAAALVAALALGAGCHDPFSNQWFEEDALFRAAIPDAERVTTRVPAADERDGWWAVPPPYAGVAEFPVWTYETSHELNTFIFTLLYVVEAISAEPIALRDEDERRWGPYPSGAGHDIWLEMVRVDDRFDYELIYSASGDSHDRGAVPFRGSFVAGTVPREGVGSFSYDFGVMYGLEPTEESLADGVIYVEHDNSDGQVLLSIDLDGIVDGGSPWSARYSFFWEPSGSGWFEFATTANLEGSDPEFVEEFEVRTRWQSDHAGRADARVWGGDLAGLPGGYHVTECWDTSYLRTYYGDDTGLTQPVGDPATCVYEDEELPSHL